MPFTVLIPPQSDEKVIKILARTISAQFQGYSFTELTETLMHEEVPYAKNVSKNKLPAIIEQLDSLGVHYKIKETSSPSLKPSEPSPHNPSQKKPSTVPKPVHNNKNPIPQPYTSTISSKKKQTTIISSIVISILIISLLILLFTTSKKEHTFSINNKGISSPNSSSKQMTGAPLTEKYSENLSSNEMKSRQYLDSADLICGDPGSNAEALYRFAISFNPQNKDAWFGLLNCYRAINKRKEYSKIKKEMIELFGESVFAISHFNSNYGATEALETKNQTVSLVYKTKQKNQALLYSELFQISRRYSSLDMYSTLTILAKQHNGSGIFMTIPLSGCITYKNFREEASFQEF